MTSLQQGHNPTETESSLIETADCKFTSSDDIRSHTGFTFLGQEIPASDRMSSPANFLFMIQFWSQWVVNIPHIMTFLAYILVFTCK